MFGHGWGVIFVVPYSDDSKAFMVDAVARHPCAEKALLCHFHQGRRPANKVACGLGMLRQVARNEACIQPGG